MSVCHPHLARKRDCVDVVVLNRQKRKDGYFLVRREIRIMMSCATSMRAALGSRY
jgi:hypothetical protein